MKPACIFVGGIPGTGKTTLVKRFLEDRKFEFKQFRKLINGHESENLIILGDYSDSTKVFSGPDTFSMACQPEAEKFFEENDKNVILEGDRLFNGKMINYVLGLEKYDVLVLLLTAKNSVIEQRYKDRGSDQSTKFIDGRRTKVANIKSTSAFEGLLFEAENSTATAGKGIFVSLKKYLDKREISDTMERVEFASLDSFFE